MLEVVSLVPGAPGIRSYELETYVDGYHDVPKPAESGKANRRGFPNQAALKPARSPSPKMRLQDNKLFVEIPTGEDPSWPLDSQIEVRVEGETVQWERPSRPRSTALEGHVADGHIQMNVRLVRAGLLLEFQWDGAIQPPFRRLDVSAKPDMAVREWCIPAYHFGRQEPPPISIASAVVPTCISIVSDGQRTLAAVPDTDVSWVGLRDGGVEVSFPLSGDACRVLLVGSSGGWFAGFSRAVVDVFGFEEPRQFSPVSEAIPDLCRFLMQPSLWSPKYQMIRSFPDIDFFYIFYSLPYAVPALSIWEVLSGDQSVHDRIDSILRFALDRRLKNGPMAGALFSEYADRALVEKGEVPFGYPPFYAWHVNYPDDQLVGMDQGCNRWITAHNMGAVLWTVTYVWEFRGTLPEDIVAGATDVAEWLVRYQRSDGSWAYAYHEDGSVASPASGSGSIWNIWSLWRFARLTGERKYLESAKNASGYFKRTFTANHLYRGYWEDVYGGGKTELNTAQGYESALAAMAFAEMGDVEAAISSARDCVRHVCTRVLECRDYWTSYGGVSEQQNWAPGTYIAPTFGYAAHIAWRRSGDDVLRRFSSLAKTIGWWQDKSGGAFWLSAAVTQQPISMYREQGGGRQFWALWDSAQKVAFAVPWLIDEVNRRTGYRMKIDPVRLVGVDDRGLRVAARAFDGLVCSDSGQINWVGLESTGGSGRADYQLVLMNHAEATDCSVGTRFGASPVAARSFDAQGNPAKTQFTAHSDKVIVHVPAGHTVVLLWEKQE